MKEPVEEQAGKDDNGLQAKIFFVVWVTCCVIGSVTRGIVGFWAGALLGMVMALLVSNGVVTVIGLKRKH